MPVPTEEPAEYDQRRGSFEDPNVPGGTMPKSKYLAKLLWPFKSRGSLEAPAGVLVLPLLLALVGVGLSDKFATQQGQQDFVRSVVTKNGGKDAVELLANVKRLDLHLLRRGRLKELAGVVSTPGNEAEAVTRLRREGLESIADLHATPMSAANVAKELEDLILFEEKAAFFFYGNFRARAVTLSTRADLAFSRQWLDDAYLMTVGCLLNNLAGGPEHALAVSLGDEAAMFAYFGLERRSLLETIPLLAGSGQTQSGENAALGKAFSGFTARLGAEKTAARKIDVPKVRLSVMAMHAIVEYSLHSVLPPSYGGRSESPPTVMPVKPPVGFRRELYYWPKETVDSVWEYMYERVAAAKLAGKSTESVELCK